MPHGGPHFRRISGGCFPPPDWEDPNETEGQTEPVRYWTIDRCANLLAGEIVLTEELADRFDNRDLPFGTHVGDAYPCTVFPIRAIAEERPENYNEGRHGYEQPHGEPCRVHLGQYVTRHVPSGLETETMFCGSPDFGLKRVSYAYPLVIHDLESWADWDDPDIPLYVGDEYAIGSYETPRLTTALLTSTILRCGQPI